MKASLASAFASGSRGPIIKFYLSRPNTYAPGIRPYLPSRHTRAPRQYPRPFGAETPGGETPSSPPSEWEGRPSRPSSGPSDASPRGLPAPNKAADSEMRGCDQQTDARPVCYSILRCTGANARASKTCLRHSNFFMVTVCSTCSALLLPFRPAPSISLSLSPLPLHSAPLPLPYYPPSPRGGDKGRVRPSEVESREEEWGGGGCGRREEG